MPGVLPVINRAAVEFTVLTALALNCEIPEASKFDRKNYPYPDLLKGYQISQYDLPLVSRRLARRSRSTATPAASASTRVHLEEDTGKLTHARWRLRLVDFNRSGVPLMEIVASPTCARPPRRAPTCRSCAPSCAPRRQRRRHGRRLPSAATPTSRCARAGSTELRHQGRSQEHELLPRRPARARVRDRAPDEAARTRRAHPQETRGWVEERGVTVSQRSQGRGPRLPLLPRARPAAGLRGSRVGRRN